MTAAQHGPAAEAILALVLVPAQLALTDHNDLDSRQPLEGQDRQRLTAQLQRGRQALAEVLAVGREPNAQPGPADYDEADRLLAERVEARCACVHNHNGARILTRLCPTHQCARVWTFDVCYSAAVQVTAVTEPQARQILDDHDVITLDLDRGDLSIGQIGAIGQPELFAVDDDPVSPPHSDQDTDKPDQADERGDGQAEGPLKGGQPVPADVRNHQNAASPADAAWQAWSTMIAQANAVRDQLPADDAARELALLAASFASVADEYLLHHAREPEHAITTRGMHDIATLAMISLSRWATTASLPELRESATNYAAPWADLVAALAIPQPASNALTAQPTRWQEAVQPGTVSDIGPFEIDQQATGRHIGPFEVKL